MCLASAEYRGGGFKGGETNERRLSCLGARRRRRRRWDEGRIPRAPPEEGAARRPGTVRGGATLPARRSHGHRPAAPSPRREALCAVPGTRGQPVRSRRGSDFLREAQKEMFCSLKITGATGKKQQHCTEQGKRLQVIQTCC
ncbi:small membrane A-kinase anchor protein isoform X1 [Prinia subflava]|uniref:small membrane A-kinase anchor protein isoform X1 n=1 Tax=Prinia subflava TaxID=208062 RepID=UPI002FE40A66